MNSFYKALDKARSEGREPKAWEIPKAVLDFARLFAGGSYGQETLFGLPVREVGNDQLIRLVAPRKKQDDDCILLP